MASGVLELNDVTLSAHYNELFKQVLKDDEENVYFLTQDDFDAWLHEINHDPESQQAHLKPKNRNLTADELKKCFGNFAQVGATFIDANFGRFSEDALTKVFNVIQENKADFKVFTNIDDVIARCSTPDAFDNLKILNDQLGDASFELPDGHPQKNTCHQGGGVAQLRYWGAKTPYIHALYGNVETPRFMKERKYIDPSMDGILKDKDGIAVMLFPLMPMGYKGSKVVIDAYNKAVECGVQELFSTFVCKLYPHAMISDEYEFKTDEALALLEVALSKLDQKMQSKLLMHDVKYKTPIVKFLNKLGRTKALDYDKYEKAYPKNAHIFNKWVFRACGELYRNGGLSELAIEEKITSMIKQ